MGEGEAGRQKDSGLRRRDDSTSDHSIRPIAAGLDASGPRGRSGYILASLDGDGWIIVEAGEACLYEAVREAFRAMVVAVDAPLHPPYRGFRNVERLAVKKYGARLLPGGTPGMRVLALVGYSIYSLAHEVGVIAVETHPYTVFNRLGIERRKLISTLGSMHIVDALGALIAAVCLVEGRAEVLAGEDGVIVLPGESCAEKTGVLLNWRQ